MESERRFNIATGKSRFERRWHNEALTWGELRGRLSEPVVTSETAADYRLMTRERQTEVKDVGGFVGGYLDNGLRKAGSVRVRSLVTLDYDDFSAARLEGVRGALKCRWLLHSTHKHREGAWRVRLVIPTDSDMTADQYGAVARRLAERCGTEGIDRSTFEPCRLMFWPSRSADAPWLFEESAADAPLLSVTEILGSYRDWRDMSEWPLLGGESSDGLFGRVAGGEGGPGCRSFSFGGDRQEDPREKSGLVGTFCRTYGVEDAIGAFLAEIYTRSGNNRYTHSGSSTSGGGWVLDDGRFFYSFHGTDPVQGRLLNSWDLVRLHKFGSLDATSGKETRGARLPSYKRMEELAMGDSRVKVTLMKERQEAARKDFGGFDLTDMAPEEKEGKSAGQTEWEMQCAERLRFGKDGSVVTTISSAAFVIGGEPRLKGKLRLNDFSGFIDVTGELPWRRNSPTWTNNDDSCLRAWLDREYGMTGKEKIADALVEVANANGYHPVKDYLDGLEWDGVARLDGLFVNVLGAEDTRLNRELARLFFTAAVRRIYRPGEKFDYFIILHGPEGTGKSSLFALMAGESWFSDSVKSIEGKEGMESVQGSWIIELGELVGIKRSEVASVKNFISSQVDKYRPAYGRQTEVRPRQCVLVGTTNEDLFLRGITTGNRREPVVEIRPELRSAGESVREYVGRWRDQLWAEAVVEHRKGEPLMLDAELTEEVRKVQDRHNLDKTNPLFPEIDRFLEMHLPAEWDKMDTGRRWEWLRTNDGEENYFSQRRRYVTVPEILQELFGMKKTDKDYLARSREVGQHLNSLKGEWKNIGNKKNKLYGCQKTWERSGEGEILKSDILDGL